MRNKLTMAIAALACAISGTAYSAETMSKEDVVRVERLLPFLSIYHQFLLSPTPQNCKNPPVVLGLPTCVIPVEVWLVNSDGTDFCLTRLPKEATFDRLTRVVWKLNARTLTSSTTGRIYNIEFHSNGVLPFFDRFGQLIGGGYGDGGAGGDRAWYNRLNLHSQVDPAIVYLPLILQINTADGNDVGVCAVGDPRMVNE
jgi:hypothetical protein